MYSAARVTASSAMAGCSTTASSAKPSRSPARALRNSTVALMRPLAGTKSAFNSSRVMGDGMRLRMSSCTDALSYMKPSEAMTGSTKRTRDTGQHNSGSSSKSLSNFACSPSPSTRPWVPALLGSTAAPGTGGCPSGGAAPLPAKGQPPGTDDVLPGIDIAPPSSGFQPFASSSRARAASPPVFSNAAEARKWSNPASWTFRLAAASGDASSSNTPIQISAFTVPKADNIPLRT
mmetsp:Transcript_132267/g.334152  ORF Transcript_132267/g.334152 Transcript_132267/m.334152 type:complete len:234 (-) Transcript_132267:261-962(-)